MSCPSCTTNSCWKVYLHIKTSVCILEVGSIYWTIPIQIIKSSKQWSLLYLLRHFLMASYASSNLWPQQWTDQKRCWSFGKIDLFKLKAFHAGASFGVTSFLCLCAANTCTLIASCFLMDSMCNDGHPWTKLSFFQLTHLPWYSNHRT